MAYALRNGWIVEYIGPLRPKLTKQAVKYIDNIWQLWCCRRTSWYFQGLKQVVCLSKQYYSNLKARNQELQMMTMQAATHVPSNISNVRKDSAHTQDSNHCADYVLLVSIGFWH